ncbi:MAG: hypothetical protein ACHQE6_06960 [Solirubrobacterales bacterium]
MAAEALHLLEDGEHHEMSEGDRLGVWKLDERPSRSQRDGDDLGIADLGRQRGLDVVRSDEKHLAAAIEADQHATVEIGWRREVARCEGPPDLTLDDIFPRLT